jgi:RimK family alpha-L-glutamate ligase
LDVTLASLYDLKYISKDLNNSKLVLRIGDRDIRDFSLIYIRMVGKRMEEATLVVNYARENNIKVVDRVYNNSLFIPSTVSKAMEMKKLINAGVPMPKTLFASLKVLRDIAVEEYSFPFVLKSTSGRKARDAWIVDSSEKMDELFGVLREREKTGVHFFAQSLVKATQRIRVLVVGNEAIGAITRPTKWRKIVSSGLVVEGTKMALINIEKRYVDLALLASRAVDLDIAGVDILEEDTTGNLFVIEANAAPAWKLITKDCNVNVEEKILKFLATKI